MIPFFDKYPLVVKEETYNDLLNLNPSDAALLVALAGKRCYKSFEVGLNPNITKIRSDLCEYVDNILLSGHGSVLEHAVHSFAIENISRVFTAEMNRHRAGWAISEGSMRFIRFDDIQAWLPSSIIINKNDSEPDRYRKIETERLFIEAFKQDEINYKELCDLWDIDNMKDFNKKKQLTSLFRRIIPMGIATGGIWTGNIRALRHVITLRNSAASEEEICYVFSRIAKMMLEKEKMLFGDFEFIDGYFKPKYVKV